MDDEATLLNVEQALRAVGLKRPYACESPRDLVEMQVLIQWV